jgi:putative FmdB family regulatory protein
MRLYDFQCEDCANEFEELVREIADARCPKCGSAHVAKQLSAFAVGSASAGAAASRSSPREMGGCGGGGCGGGMCGMN